MKKQVWRSWTPHKVKLAVSGCPRNGAEATLKDVGIVCVDSGFEIGGSGAAAGMDVKKVEPLVEIATEDAAIAWTVAFVQLYRERPKYLDRPYKWLAKVGLVWVREVLDHEAALVARFDLSQSVYQNDPWAERAMSAARRAFAPLADLTQEAAE